MKNAGGTKLFLSYFYRVIVLVPARRLVTWLTHSLELLTTDLSFCRRRAGQQWPSQTRASAAGNITGLVTGAVFGKELLSQWLRYSSLPLLKKTLERSIQKSLPLGTRNAF